MKLLNLSEVGQIRRRKGTSMKRMINDDTLEVKLCKQSVLQHSPEAIPIQKYASAQVESKCRGAEGWLG